MRALDSYVTEHNAEWARLEQLVRQANKRHYKLSGAELDELLNKYQRVSAHLSFVRSAYADPQINARLTRVVAGARAVVYGTQPRAGGAIGSFFTVTFPAAVWAIRRFILVSALALLLPGIAVGVWVANSDAAVSALGPAALRESYIENDFEEYYSSGPAAEFATEVLVNNIRVSFLAYVVGIAWAVPTVALLAYNGAHVGVAAGLFHAAGQAPKFWGLILPHGLLELTAIVVAGGAGMQMGWALIDPGDRPRSQALVEEAQRSASVIIGLMIVFVFAGLIEGFVTPSPLSTWARVSIGVAAFCAFWAYILALGPKALAEGATGAITQNMRVTDDSGT